MIQLILWLTQILELCIGRWKDSNRLLNILLNKLPFRHLKSHPKVMPLGLIATFDWVCTTRQLKIIQWLLRLTHKIFNISIIVVCVMKEFINTIKLCKILLHKLTFHNVHHHISFVDIVTILWVSLNWL